MPIRLTVFEDSADFRELLTETVQSAGDVILTGAYPHANNAVEVIADDRPDVVLMDIQMPGATGIDATEAIKRTYPGVQILVQTVFEDNARIFASICAGASGYLLKDSSPEQYLTAIREVYSGGSPMTPSIARKVLTMFQQQQLPRRPLDVDLTPTEHKVLECLTRGLSYKLIAHQCGISHATVNFHLKNIYRKLHVNSAPEAVARALRDYLI